MHQMMAANGGFHSINALLGIREDTYCPQDCAENSYSYQRQHDKIQQQKIQMKRDAFKNLKFQGNLTIIDFLYLYV